MVEFGDLSLWAALPFLAAAASASLVGGMRSRSGLSALGRRLCDASALLLLLGLAALGYALVAVKLKLAIVQAYSGFQVAPGYRLSALWVAPGGGALLLVTLIALMAVLSSRIDESPAAAARTGTLSAIALVGLALVIVRATPFAALPVPATVGLGLPLATQTPAFSLEVWAVFLALACSAFTFSGIVGAQLVEKELPHRIERTLAAAGAALLTVAVFTATWRAYGGSGELLSSGTLGRAAASGGAWLIALAYLHAPGGPAAVWAVRWRRVLGVALFPATLGAAGALLAAGGGSPVPTIWVAGLAVGVISGSMSGMGARDRSAASLEKVPGYGVFALSGGLVSLAAAGLAAVGTLMNGAPLEWTAWGMAVLALSLVCYWLLSRRVEGRRLTPVSLAAAAASAGLVGAAASLAIEGERSAIFSLAAALAAAILVGSALDLSRLKAAASGMGGSTPKGVRRMIWEVRSLRRAASIAAHLGMASVVVGMAGGLVGRSSTRLVRPGDRFSLGGPGSDAPAVTYLGLSRFQDEGLSKTVASFMLAGTDGGELITAESTYDFLARAEHQAPALKRGLVVDVSASIAGRAEGEDILVRLAIRPLTSALWLGGALLFAAVFLSAGSGFGARERGMHDDPGLA